VTDTEDAYARGIKDGAVKSLDASVARAHKRLDTHSIRLTSLERVMYAGMGVIVMLQLGPQIALWMAK